MPCWSGVLPVAIVVQMIGLSSGGLLISRPYAPSCRSLAKFGILPSAMSRSITCGSIPSRPTTSRRARGASERQPSARSARRITTSDGARLMRLRYAEGRGAVKRQLILEASSACRRRSICSRRRRGVLSRARSMDERTRADHDRRMSLVVAQMRELAVSRAPAHVDKGGVHHVVPLPAGDGRFSGRRIDVSALHHVLEVDVERRRCVAEPGVTFRELVDATLRHGLVPAIVPELEGITVGGAVAGCSVESASFRYGGFHDTCLEYEIVSGTGEVLTCSPEREPLLFGMIHGSYGTLGILTKLSFGLIPAKTSVQVEYHRYTNGDAFHQALLGRAADATVDFIDGIVHARDHWTLCLGRFVETARQPSSYRWLDVYYQSTRRLGDDVLTARDYFFRYDTEAHWLSRTVP